MHANGPGGDATITLTTLNGDVNIREISTSLEGSLTITSSGSIESFGTPVSGENITTSTLTLNAQTGIGDLDGPLDTTVDTVNITVQSGNVNLKNTSTSPASDTTIKNIVEKGGDVTFIQSGGGSLIVDAGSITGNLGLHVADGKTLHIGNSLNVSETLSLQADFMDFYGGPSTVLAPQILISPDTTGFSILVGSSYILPGELTITPTDIRAMGGNITYVGGMEILVQAYLSQAYLSQASRISGSEFANSLPQEATLAMGEADQILAQTPDLVALLERAENDTGVWLRPSIDTKTYVTGISPTKLLSKLLQVKRELKQVAKEPETETKKAQHQVKTAAEKPSSLFEVVWNFMTNLFKGVGR